MFKVEPLVSIIVVTYNSSEYVLETLESTKTQTYKKIELIISDDCSTDNTVNICEKWINDYKNEFVNTKILTTSRNTGIPSNVNRGIKACNGEWIKLVAGDDTLVSTCIEDNINFVQNNKDIKCCHSKVNIYNDDFKDSNFFGESNYPPKVLSSESSTAKEQFNFLIFKCNISAPSVFMKKELISKFGGYDESIPQCEDWPMWLDFSRAGHKLYFLNKVTANYRVRSSSVFNSGGINKIFNSFFKVERDVYKKHIKPYTTLKNRLVINYAYIVKNIFEITNLNKSNYFCNKIYWNVMRPYRRHINKIDL